MDTALWLARNFYSPPDPPPIPRGQSLLRTPAITRQRVLESLVSRVPKDPWWSPDHTLRTTDLVSLWRYCLVCLYIIITPSLYTLYHSRILCSRAGSSSCALPTRESTLPLVCTLLISHFIWSFPNYSNSQIGRIELHVESLYVLNSALAALFYVDNNKICRFEHWACFPFSSHFCI